MSKKRNLLEETLIEIEGQQVSLKRFKEKDRRRPGNARSTTTTCPNCMSIMKINESGVWYCTGDRLKVWEKEFEQFFKFTPEKKAEYLSSLSNDSRFLELYDRWEYAYKNDVPEEFVCDYTNNIFLPIGSNQVRIPDPIFVRNIEDKLGRKLTEEELIGEEKLYYHKGHVTDKWHKNGKEIKIPYVLLPSETTIYIW